MMVSCILSNFAAKHSSSGCQAKRMLLSFFCCQSLCFLILSFQDTFLAFFGKKNNEEKKRKVLFLPKRRKHFESLRIQKNKKFIFFCLFSNFCLLHFFSFSVGNICDQFYSTMRFKDKKKVFLLNHNALNEIKTEKKGTYAQSELTTNWLFWGANVKFSPQLL